MNRIPMTREGLERLKAQLNHLETVERPANIRAIEEARSHGDLSENAEYHAAKERQSFLEGKINEIKAAIGKSEVLDVKDGPENSIAFGRTVLLCNVNTEEEVRYQLVGPYESEPENGKISISSPLGQALVGRKVGDEVVVKAPGGIQEFEILDIS
ncbi:MAG: transcription elongation factor GreA [Pseudomonadota bacterium]